MSDSTAKTRSAWLAATALPLLVSCATGADGATAFSRGSAGTSYDAALDDATQTIPPGDSARDPSYGQAPAAPCDAWVAAADVDGGTADADDGGAADTDDAEATAVAPSVGDLVITELMFDPSGPVPEAQWFEIYNLTAMPELLSGLTIQDGWGDTQVIASGAPVIAPPFGYVVLVRDLATAVADAVPGASIVYEYGAGLPSDQGIELAFDVTGDLSIWSGNLQLADVPYGPWGLSSLGQSIELGPLQYAGADQAASWCLAQSPWAPGSDDGTPGLPNDCP